MSPEPAHILGVKVIWLVAGFAGGVVSLRYIEGLTTPQMFSAVLSGVACSAYLSPLVFELARRQEIILSERIEGGIAFLIGLTAINIVPGILKLSAMFKTNPGRFLGGDKND